MLYNYTLKICLYYKRYKFFFNIGKIYRVNKRDPAIFAVNSINDLNNVIIPHFIKYPLLTQKKVDFLLFNTILELMRIKKHLTSEGLIEIINTKASMNKGLTPLFRNNFTSIVPVIKPKVKLVTVHDISPYWFCGFTDGEGCFLLMFVLIEKIMGLGFHWYLLLFKILEIFFYLKL